MALRNKQDRRKRKSLEKKLGMEQLEMRSLMAADVAPPAISFDGTGHNVANPSWGKSGVDFLRLAPAQYADGKSAPSGSDRPSARAISNAVADEDVATINDRHMTAMIYAWGQFLDHDIDLTMGASPAEAFNIPVPSGDLEFDPAGTGSKVIPLSRSQYNSATGTTNARQQFNSITAWVDGSQVYGSDATTAASLRTKSGGKMTTSDGGLLPVDATTGFFQAGDIRANENIELLSMHSLFVREHNRLADEIAARTPGLTDEQIYQRARSMVIGELQAITYNEFLPAMLGTDGLKPYSGYKPTVNPGISNEFATAAFRVGHTMLGEDIEFLDNNGNEVRDPVALRDAFFNPGLLKETGIDTILKYLGTDNAREVDTKIVEDVRNFLFGPPGAGGFDLASLNIQRGRDHGLADYNSSRLAFGLPRVTQFSEITSNPELQTKLRDLYGSVNNIDLWVGGLAEDHVPGGSVGPTFRRIIADQFERLRDGDRFFYLNSPDANFREQAGRTRLSDVIQRNSTARVQGNVFYDQATMTLKTPPQAAADLAVVMRDGKVDLVDRKANRVIESRSAANVGQVVVATSETQVDRVMIDASRAASIPHVEVDGGAGTGDTLIVRTAPTAQNVVVKGRTVFVDGQKIDFSRFETVSIESAPSTKVSVQTPPGMVVLVNGKAQTPPPPSNTPTARTTSGSTSTTTSRTQTPPPGSTTQAPPRQQTTTNTTNNAPPPRRTAPLNGTAAVDAVFASFGAPLR